MTHCSETYGSPIRIPTTDLRKCSLLCSIEFIYPDTQWNMTAVEVRSKDTSQKLLRYYVRDPDESTPRADVRYNSNTYSLQFLEFFVPSAHEYIATNATEGEHYDMEVILYHRDVSKQKWLNVSVFVTPMYTYNISQGFFSTLLEPLKADVLSKSTTFLPGVTYATAPTNTAQCTSSSNNQPKQTGKCILISADDRWNPYMALPLKKSFYIYRGNFPCDTSVANVYPTDATEVTCVLMANTVAMHYNDYEHIKRVYAPKKKRGKPRKEGYTLNKGSVYSPKNVAGRPVYYNDGTYVQGNMDRDRFFVKCTKKEQKPAVKRLDFAPNADVDDAASAVQKKDATYLFYTPPESAMSNIVLCFFVSFWLLSIFHVHNSTTTMAKATFMLFLAFAIFIMILPLSTYSDSSNSSTLQLLIIYFWTWLSLIVFNFAHAPLSELHPQAPVVLLVLKGGIVLFLLIITLSVSATASSTTKYATPYYHLSLNKQPLAYDIESTPVGTQFYIGTKADVGINIAGHAFYEHEGLMHIPLESLTHTLIPDTTKPDDEQLRRDRLHQILQQFSKYMGNDHRYPKKQFLEAAWDVLKREYNVLQMTKTDLTGPSGNLTKEIPDVLQYLETNPTTGGSN
jgi:hypothetical protein